MMLIQKSQYDQLNNIKLEYKNVIEINTKLKQEINTKYEENKKFTEIIQIYELEIKELKINNKELEKINKQLNDEIEYIKKENEELNKIILEQNNKIKEQTININELKNDIKIIKQKEQYKKYITAIQDINRLISLENKKYYNYDIKKNLEKLRNDRNSDNHYILEDNDDDNLINDKRIILVEQIDNMPNEIKNRFNKKYPKLLENIIGYIEPNNNIISSTENEEDVREWWTE